MLRCRLCNANVGVCFCRIRATRFEDMPHCVTAESFLSTDLVLVKVCVSFCRWFASICTCLQLLSLSNKPNNSSAKGMIGSGRVSVAAAAELSRATLVDLNGKAPQAVQALASLGCGGSHGQNQERDLHRWAHNLYDLDLDTYDVPMQLQVSRCAKRFRSDVQLDRICLWESFLGKFT